MSGVTVTWNMTIDTWNLERKRESVSNLLLCRFNIYLDRPSFVPRDSWIALLDSVAVPLQDRCHV